jgi:Glycoside-hydrolase family GH114
MRKTRPRWLVVAFVFLVSCSSTPSSGEATASRANAGMWKPAVGDRWQYQLQNRRAFADTGGINVAICAEPFSGGACVRPDVFDIDLYGIGGGLATTAVDAIHEAGAHAICYIDAGSIETYRPDYPSFVRFDKRCEGCLIGNPFSKVFNDENWANINNDQGQRDFMLEMNEARVARCEEAGFDAVEFDVVEAYNSSYRTVGWHISARTQLTFNSALADIAHRHGMSVGLKNDLGQIPDLLPKFDFAINEQCFQYDECDSLARFIQAGKPVFQVEYRLPLEEFCPKADDVRFSSILKSPHYSLFDTPYTPCE